MKGKSIIGRSEHPQTGIKKIRLRFLLPLVLLLAVAAIACSSDSSSSSSSSSIIGDESASKGFEAPNFSITMFQGEDVVGSQEVDLHSLIGTKPIVLNFWAGLCPPCRAEMPDLQEFNEEFEDRTLLLGIDLGRFTGLGSQEEAKELLEELEVTYPAGFTNDSSVIRDYQVLGMPTTIFIDTDGKIFNKWTGALNSSVLKEKAEEMLAQ